MRFLQKISLKHKLIGIILVVTLFALSIGFIVYTTNAVSNLKNDLRTSMVVNAKLISEYSVSPILFDDKNGASEILQKINAIAEIEEAYIFDNEGLVFVSYKKAEEGSFPEFKNIEWSEFEDDYLHVYQPIKFLDTQYGTIYLKVSTSILSDRIMDQISIMLMFSALILILSWILASRMQRLISDPILKLANVTEQISDKHDFSIRIIKHTEDEIGVLYDQFNNLIGTIEQQQIQQRANELALRASEEKYRHIFENSMVGIYRVKIDTGEIIDSNEAAIRILQLNKVRSKRMKNMYVNLDDRKKLIDMLKKDGVVDNIQTRLKRGDGKIIWVSISGRAYDNGTFYEGVLQDISSNKENYLNLKKANFELDNFVYHTSHDLRSPLLSVLGLVNIAKQETNLDQLNVLLSMIEKSIKKLDGLVNDLLILSRDNRVNDPFSIIDVKVLIDECLENYDFLDNYKSIDINVKVDSKAPLYSDRTRFNVILNNLLSNAIKYHRKEGVKPFIHVSTWIDAEKCILKIEDNGEGIEDKFHNKIFDMFFRATESSEGSGLGLYIVKNVLEKLNGTIEFDSTEGVGTTFIVTIPNNSDVPSEVLQSTS